MMMGEGAGAIEFEQLGNAFHEPPKIRRHKDVVPFLIFVRPKSLGVPAGLVHGP
jgi:hypothetical protein